MPLRRQRTPSPRVGPRFVVGAWILVVAVGWWGAAASAQDPLVPYTVQIAALSDAETAIGLTGELLRDGFPGYVVRAEGAAGPVFRVRVAAFGDRASADRYARAIGDRYGGTPQPALAEAIPSGLLPLAPLTVAQVEAGTSAALIPWHDGFALRLGEPGERAVYRVLVTGESFEAWFAIPIGETGRATIETYPLDGEGAAQDDPAVRDALYRQRVRLVADALGVEADVVAAEAVRGEPGARYLLVWRSSIEEVAQAVVGALRVAAEPTSRAAEAWIGTVPPVAPMPAWTIDGSAGIVRATIDPVTAEPAGEAREPSPVDTSVNSESQDVEGALLAAGDVEGRGWRAEQDGAWTRLYVQDTTWRALVGAPIWGAHDVLLVAVEDGYVLVRLVPR